MNNRSIKRDAFSEVNAYTAEITPEMGFDLDLDFTGRIVLIRHNNKQIGGLRDVRQL